ncbi:hypothetical protein [Paraburkholderia hospita]|uniref:hypothetical protein n=1 Tax=Paraburkholderia TaxID=1822464 RepID=UPI0014054361|nr:hypothetical protein [Paraburkholderia hospita]
MKKPPPQAAFSFPAFGTGSAMEALSSMRRNALLPNEAIPASDGLPRINRI